MPRVQVTADHIDEAPSTRIKPAEGLAAERIRFDGWPSSKDIGAKRFEGRVEVADQRQRQESRCFGSHGLGAMTRTKLGIALLQSSIV